MTCSSTSQADASSRMSSLASATTSPSTSWVTDAASGMPTAISNHPREMHRLFARYPEALARTVEIVDRCRFSLDELAYQYPEECADPSLTPQETLENLTREGAAWRYPEGLPDDVVQTLRHERQSRRRRIVRARGQ